MIKFVEEEEKEADNDESDSKADNEEDKLLVTLYSVLYIQSHSVLSSRNITTNEKLLQNPLIFSFIYFKFSI